MLGIIPAAGRGVRFKELGKHYNKTILPYKEKPILIHQIEFLESQGCDQIRVVVNHKEDTIRYVLKQFNKSYVHLVKQEERNGLSGAIYAALNKDDDTNVLILLGDLVVNDKQLYQTFNTNFISVKRVPDYSRWCMVKQVSLNVLQFFDKPKERPETDLAVSGIYHFTDSQKLLQKLQNQLNDDSKKIDGEFQLSTVLQEISEEERIDVINVNLIDFGTLEEYLQNRSVKNSRSFNEIIIDGNFITKSSSEESEKIIKECNWFSNLPDDISVKTPRIFSKNFYGKSASYKMEKILSPSLREIYLFLDSTRETWESIVSELFSTLNCMENYGKKNGFMRSVIDKTKKRVEDINIDININLISKFIKDLEINVNKFSRPALMHGDFCFSNLLYDFQNNKITMIDPRGELFGDHYYEVAKVCHSALYDYDFVDAELYSVGNDGYWLYNDGKDEVKELFNDYLKQNYSQSEIAFIKLLTASLFLSMIPLHSHNINNQKIYYEIFKKIYQEVLNG